MTKTLRFVITYSISTIILLLVSIMSVELQSQYSIYAQNSTTTVNEVSKNDTSRFYIPTTISNEAQAMLKNITSNMIPPFVTPGPNDIEGWNELNQTD